MTPLFFIFHFPTTRCSPSLTLIMEQYNDGTPYPYSNRRDGGTEAKFTDNDGVSHTVLIPDTYDAAQTKSTLQEAGLPSDKLDSMTAVDLQQMYLQAGIDAYLDAINCPPPCQ